MSIADQINALITAIRNERDFIADEHGFAEDIATSLAVDTVADSRKLDRAALAAWAHSRL
jgi:hypothetical protein